MAVIETSSSIDRVHGKLQKQDKGYFYIRNGKQFYRDREETYQHLYYVATKTAIFRVFQDSINAYNTLIKNILYVINFKRNIEFSTYAFEFILFGIVF